MRTAKETLDIIANCLWIKGAKTERSSAGYSYDVSFNGEKTTVTTQEVDHLAVYNSSNLESYADSIIKDLTKEPLKYDDYDGTIESEFA